MHLLCQDNNINLRIANIDNIGSNQPGWVIVGRDWDRTKLVVIRLAQGVTNLHCGPLPPSDPKAPWDPTLR